MSRPTNKAIQKNKNGNKKLGRPPGDKAIMDEYKARMLTSPKSRLVLDTILSAALDDDHKHQAVAWKIVADRVLPLASFDPDKNKGSGGIQISISTLGNVDISSKTSNEDIEADYEEVDGA